MRFYWNQRLIVPWYLLIFTWFKGGFITHTRKDLEGSTLNPVAPDPPVRVCAIILGESVYCMPTSIGTLEGNHDKAIET